VTSGSEDGGVTGPGRGASPPARRFELQPLMAVAVFSVAGLAFTLFAGAVVGGDTRAFDTWLLRALREPNDLADPIGPPWFEEMVRDITALGSTFVLTSAVMVVGAYLWMRRSPQKALFLVVAVSLGALLNRLLKIGFARPRPDIVAHGMYVSTESFPSGHAANSTVVYLLLGMMLARVETSSHAKIFILAVSVLVTLLVGFSRVYLGVHWPADVLAGWLVGAVWALLCWYVLLHLQPGGPHR